MPSSSATSNARKTEERIADEHIAGEVEYADEHVTSEFSQRDLEHVHKTMEGNIAKMAL